MSFFSEFHWWYLLIGVAILMVFTGKGGIVVKRYTAALEVLDGRFADCPTEVTYAIFKQGKPEKIEIEIEHLPLERGETLDIEINGSQFATMTVKRDREAEFEHWSDDGVAFRKIRRGDQIVIKHDGKPIFKGVFEQEGANA